MPLNFGPFTDFSPTLFASYFDVPSVTKARFFDVIAKPLESCRTEEQIDTSAQVSSPFPQTALNGVGL